MAMNLIRKIRQKFYTARVRRQCASAGVDLRVNGRSTVGKNTYLGDHVNFNGMLILNGECRIGNYFHSGRGCQILNQNHDYEGKCIPYDDQTVYKKVTIEDCVWLGNNVIIVGNAHIGEGAIIQAGSVVTGDIPKCAIAGGNPAKVFKYRDIEHYEQCKADGKFF